MKPIFKILTLLIIASFLLTCKDNPVGPDDGNATPGRRDYTWTIDTVGYPTMDFYDIWGNSPDNIWISGALMSNSLYNFDGVRWKLDRRAYIIDPIALWGNEDNIWIGNDQGSIWRFTGDGYEQELKDFKLDGKFMSFIAMEGKSNKEIYAAGGNYINPLLMKYDGHYWAVDKTLPDSSIFNQFVYSSRTDRYYIVSELRDYTSKVYEFDKKNLKLIYSYNRSDGAAATAVIDGYLYITVKNKVYRYYNDKMEFIFENKDPNFGGVIWGRNRNDIFIRMLDGLAHYNGTDWVYLFKSEQPILLPPNSQIFEKDFFITVKLLIGGNNIVYHGTLK